MIRSARKMGVGGGLIASTAIALASPALASIEFTGTGINPEVGVNASGSALCSISGDLLTIVLTNTTDPRTTSQGNAMTGIAFDITGASPTLSLSSIALTGGSAIWTSKFASNTSDPISGSWTSVLGVAPLASFGAATSGFGGAFNGGSITRGNSGPDYGIVAANTFDGTNVSFGGSQYPFFQKSLTLNFSGALGLSESQLANVKLLFGTDGTGVITTTPAPGALALLGLAGLVGARRRRG